MSALPEPVERAQNQWQARAFNILLSGDPVWLDDLVRCTPSWHTTARRRRRMAQQFVSWLRQRDLVMTGEGIHCESCTCNTKIIISDPAGLARAARSALAPRLSVAYRSQHVADAEVTTETTSQASVSAHKAVSREHHRE